MRYGPQQIHSGICVADIRNCGKRELRFPFFFPDTSRIMVTNEDIFRRALLNARRTSMRELNTNKETDLNKHLIECFIEHAMPGLAESKEECELMKMKFKIWLLQEKR